jgi:hypothetical protein
MQGEPRRSDRDFLSSSRQVPLHGSCGDGRSDICNVHPWRVLGVRDRITVQKLSVTSFHSRGV